MFSAKLKQLATSPRLRQASMLYAGTLLATLLGVAVSAVNARLLGSAAYGNFRFIQVVATTCLLSLTLGFFNSGSRIIAHEDNKEAYRSIIGACLFLVLLISIVGTLVLVPFSYVQGDVFGNAIGPEFRLAIVFVAWVPLQFALQRILEGTNQIVLLSLLRFFPRLLYLLCLLALYRWVSFGLREVVLGYFGCFLLVCLALAATIRPNFRNLGTNLRQLWHENKRFGIHIYVALLFGVVFAQLSPIVINLVGESKEMGFYLLAVTITQPLALLPGIVGSSQFRDFASRERVPPRVLRGTLAVSAVTLAGFFVLIRPVVRLIYSAEFLPVAGLASFLAVGAALHGFGDFFNRFLQVKGKGKGVRNGSVFSGIASLIGTVSIVPLFGVWGAVAVFLFAKSIYAAIIVRCYLIHVREAPVPAAPADGRRFLSHLAKQAPAGKKLYIRLRYMLVRFVLRRTYGAVKLDPRTRLVSVPCALGRQSLKGYYNVRLFNRRGKMLYGETAATSVRGSLQHELYLMLYDIAGGTARKLTTTKAWNWQQGCMLQWFAGSDNRIIYNDYLEEQDAYCTRMLDTESGDETTLPLPYYSVAASGEFFLTLDFRRLARLRPDYGYFNHRNAELLADDEDGIWRVDVSSGASSLIISLADLRAFVPDETMPDATHKVNHIDIAPSGGRFMFLHRWIGKAGRFTRLMTANCQDGQDLRVICGNEMVSHCCWHGDAEIISYCAYQPQKHRYVRFDALTGEARPFAASTLVRDGHPSVSPNRDWLLTDSYPDAARNSRLYLCDLESEQCITVGRFLQPFKFTRECRVDLHPVWGCDGRWVAIDSGHEGRRRVCLVDVGGFRRQQL